VVPLPASPPSSFGTLVPDTGHPDNTSPRFEDEVTCVEALRTGRVEQSNGRPFPDLMAISASDVKTAVASTPHGAARTDQVRADKSEVTWPTDFGA
jgi:hypothetical protein